MKTKFYKFGHTLATDTHIFMDDRWRLKNPYFKQLPEEEITIEDFLQFLDTLIFSSWYTQNVRNECIRILKENIIDKAINDL